MNQYQATPARAAGSALAGILHERHRTGAARGRRHPTIAGPCMGGRGFRTGIGIEDAA
jgi:hypothetical protein